MSDTSHEVMKQFTFCAAHRVAPHAGKCRFLHGHNYKCEVFARWHRLDESGMVIDFGDLMGIANGEVLPKLDHVTILQEDDPLLEHLMNANEEIPMAFYTTKKPPTAEVIAEEILEMFRAQVDDDAEHCEIYKVIVWETETCCGIASIGSS